MNVYILGFDETYAGLIVGMMDIFNQAMVQCNDRDNFSSTEPMKVYPVSVDGKPILCQNNFLLNVHCAIEDIRQADIVIIASIHNVDKTLSKYGFMIDWLKEQYAKGTCLASICTGAFLLAETGLLDGKEATTHWSMSEVFRKRYPRVWLKSEKLVISSDNLICSGGAGTSTDLAYVLLERYMGHSLASRTAKHFIHDFRRVSQHPYEIYTANTEHNDRQVLKAQDWITQHLHEPIILSDLAKIACMSIRTFERRFRKATGDTPTVYIQRIKVEMAKQQLETTNLSFEEIAYRLGYMNSGAFRKIFVRWVNLLPTEYRMRFQSYDLKKSKTTFV